MTLSVTQNHWSKMSTAVVSLLYKNISCFQIQKRFGSNCNFDKWEEQNFNFTKKRALMLINKNEFIFWQCTKYLSTTTTYINAYVHILLIHCSILFSISFIMIITYLNFLCTFQYIPKMFVYYFQSKKPICPSKLLCLFNLKKYK